MTMKTPEQMAEEYAYSQPDNWPSWDIARHAFLAGYKAAKDEELAKDKSIADAWKQNVDKMLPSVHAAVLFPSQSTKASDPDVVAKMDAAIKKAKNELADSCEHILDMEKMVDLNFSNNSNGWISVKERLPEYDVDVLTFETGNYEVNAVSKYTQWWWDSDEGFERNPTHWMPLPEAPKEEG